MKYMACSNILKCVMNSPKNGLLVRDAKRWWKTTMLHSRYAQCVIALILVSVILLHGPHMTSLPSLFYPFSLQFYFYSSNTYFLQDFSVYEFDSYMKCQKSKPHYLVWEVKIGWILVRTISAGCFSIWLWLWHEMSKVKTSLSGIRGENRLNLS